MGNGPHGLTTQEIAGLDVSEHQVGEDSDVSSGALVPGRSV